MPGQTNAIFDKGNEEKKSINALIALTSDLSKDHILPIEAK